MQKFEAAAEYHPTKGGGRAYGEYNLQNPKGKAFSQPPSPSVHIFKLIKLTNSLLDLSI